MAWWTLVGAFPSYSFWLLFAGVAGVLCCAVLCCAVLCRVQTWLLLLLLLSGTVHGILPLRFS